MSPLVAPSAAHVAWSARLANWVAIGQGARTAFVAFGGFAIGYWGYNRLQIAVFATFGGLALTGIANFGGTMRGRLAANAVAGTAGVGLSALGTWASSRPAGVAVALTFAVGVAVVIVGLFGGYWAVAPNAVILYYLVAVGSPTPITTIPDRVYGVLIGAALAAVSSVALWPENTGPDMVHILATRVQESGQSVLSTSSGETPVPDQAGPQPPVNLRADRPSGPTRIERAGLYLLNDLERLHHLVLRASRTPLSAVDREALSRAGNQLVGVADALAGQTVPRWAEVGVDSDGPGGPVNVEGSVLPFGIAYRVLAVTAALTSHAVALVEASHPAGIPGTYISPVLHGVRRLRAHLSWRSVHLQDGVRTGAALALAYLLADELALQHGFWVDLATLTVVRSGATTTTRSIGQAVVGTIIGVAVAFAVIDAAASNVTAYAVMTPVAIALAIYLRSAINFAAGQAGFTVSVLTLFSLLRPAGWHIGIVRLEDVLVGAAAGLVASVVAWPRGSVAAIAPAAADLIDKSFDYLQRVVQQVDPPGCGAASSGSERVEPTRQAALAAMLVAEAAFSQLMAERSDQSDTVAWSPIMAAGNRLWYAADIISASGSPPMYDRLELSRALGRVAQATRHASETLRRRGSLGAPVPDPVPEPTGTDDPLADWMDDLAIQFETLFPTDPAGRSANVGTGYWPGSNSI